MNVMVFGFFDGLHSDHEEFLRAARIFGDRVSAVVLQDHVVRELKGALPANNFTARFEELQKNDRVDEVLIGDPAFGVLSAIKKHAPDIVVFGSRQHALRRDFEKNAHRLKQPPVVRTVVVQDPHL